MLASINISQSLIELAQNATNNGILTFIMGTLFVLTVYHFLLYFQHKDKSYLFYSIYTFLIILAYLNKVENGFIKSIATTLNIPHQLKHFFTWTYNFFYFLFAVEFLNLKQINKRWYQYIIIPVSILYGFGVIAQIGVSYFNSYAFFNAYSSVYVTLITLLTIISFYFIFKLKNTLKYYIIIGAIILFLTSVAGEKAIRELPIFNFSAATGDFIFYVGVLIENICFSLGLGQKQKHILLERNQAYDELYAKLQENENLKERVSLQLQEKINALNQQIHLKDELEDLKLSALRSQMNPHFVFNALNSIKHYIIDNDQKNAVHYLNKFSKLIRKILEASSAKETTLQEELDTMELYMSIENIRFDNIIEYHVKTDDNVNPSGIKIPPLILQPFLENAIWHGLSSSKSELKRIDINISRTNDYYLLIDIKDNGIGREASQVIKDSKHIKRKSLGITLTKDRLNQYLRDLDGSFKITYTDLKDDQDNPNGTKVRLQIPML